MNFHQPRAAPSLPSLCKCVCGEWLCKSFASFSSAAAARSELPSHMQTHKVCQLPGTTASNHFNSLRSFQFILSVPFALRASKDNLCKAGVKMGNVGVPSISRPSPLSMIYFE